MLRLLMIREAIASCRLEGIYVTPEEFFLAELKAIDAAERKRRREAKHATKPKRRRARP